MRQRVVSRLGRGRRRGMNHDEAGAVPLSQRVCFNKWMWWGDENIVSRAAFGFGFGNAKKNQKN